MEHRQILSTILFQEIPNRTKLVSKIFPIQINFQTPFYRQCSNCNQRGMEMMPYRSIGRSTGWTTSTRKVRCPGYSTPNKMQLSETQEEPSRTVISRIAVHAIRIDRNGHIRRILAARPEQSLEQRGACHKAGRTFRPRSFPAIPRRDL